MVALYKKKHQPVNHTMICMVYLPTFGCFLFHPATFFNARNPRPFGSYAFSCFKEATLKHNHPEASLLLHI